MLYNVPYGTGSHPQDVAMVMPVFVADELVGYAAIKAHWLDIGGKEPYSTDTVDVFQEGTIFPGVKLYAGGRLVEDIFRFAIANSRVPKMVAGDINATVVGVRTGAAALTRLVERHGLERFRESTARIYAHGEAVVRRWFEQLPDGRYVGHGEMDSNGVDDIPSRSTSSSRSTARTCASTTRGRRPSRPARSTARGPRRSRRAASRSRCSRAAARPRTRATSARSR